MGRNTYDTCISRYNPLLIPHRHVPCPRIPRRQTITQAHSLHNTRLQILHLLKTIQIDVLADRQCSNKVFVQALVYSWSVDYVKSCNGESKCGCFDAAAYDDLRFVGEALVGFV